jgi:hypothetical protein
MDSLATAGLWAARPRFDRGLWLKLAARFQASDLYLPEERDEKLTSIPLRLDFILHRQAITTGGDSCQLIAGIFSALQRSLFSPTKRTPECNKFWVPTDEGARSSSPRATLGDNLRLDPCAVVDLPMSLSPRRIHFDPAAPTDMPALLAQYSVLAAYTVWLCWPAVLNLEVAVMRCWVEHVFLPFALAFWP